MTLRSASVKNLMSLFVVAGFLASASLAHAEFTWAPPAQAAVVNNVAPNNNSVQNNSLMGAPVASAPLTVFPPLVIDGNGAQKNNAPVMANQNSVQPAPVMAAQPILSKPLHGKAKGEKVKGFAKNIPFFIALLQIVPVGHDYVVGSDVNMRALVSYKGGKNWLETVKSLASGMKLTVRQDGNMLVITKGEIAKPAVAEQMPVPVAMNLPAVMTSMPAIAPQAVMQVQAVRALPVNEVAGISVIDNWSVGASDTLRTVLQNWTRRAGVELHWTSEYDYPVQASISFNGTFEEAVRSLLIGFEEANPQPVGELHQNRGAKQSVLIIQTRGNSVY